MSLQWNLELPKADWFTLQTQGLEELVREIHDARTVAIDTETTGLSITKCYPLYFSLSWRDPAGRAQRACLRADAFQAFKEPFRDPRMEWVMANAKFDVHMMANDPNAGVLAGKYIDTQVMHALLYEDSPHGLKEMNKQMMGWQWADFKTTFGKPAPAEDGGYGAVLMECERSNLPKLVEYASNDAYATLRIYEELKKELQSPSAWVHSAYPEEYQNLWDIFWKTEVPFTKVLWKCERRGVKIDKSYLSALEGPMLQKLRDLERDISKVIGRPINPGSKDQLREYFLNEARLKPLGLTKGGKSGVKKASIDEKFLAYYKDKNQVAGLVSEYNDVQKTLSTYVKKLLASADQFDRVHARINQDIARTGRLSMSDPGLQQIKKPDEDDFVIRRGFIAADEDHDLIVRDYEALEMRLLSVAAQEQDMINIFLQGQDIHMGNSVLIFGPMLEKKHGCSVSYDDFVNAKKTEGKVKEGQLTHDAMTALFKDCMLYRGRSKTISFALNYGMGVDSLASRLSISVPEAQTLMDMYMARYPAVQRFFKEAVEEVRQTGFAFSFLGRRRYLPEIHSAAAWERSRAERQACNMPIQSSAAEVAKLGMLQCDAAGLDTAFGAYMLFQVHDELLFDVPKKYAVEAEKAIKRCMENPFPRDIGVPLKTSGSRARSWDLAK